MFLRVSSQIDPTSALSLMINSRGYVISLEENSRPDEADQSLHGQQHTA